MFPLFSGASVAKPFFATEACWHHLLQFFAIDTFDNLIETMSFDLKKC